MTSREAYAEVVETVDAWPHWSHTAIEVFSEGGLVAMLAGLAVIAARRRTLQALATAVAGLMATAGAYLTSAALKLAESQARPCQAMPALETVAACPPAGDWSLPSNHAVIAAGLAVAVTAVAPKLGAAAIPLAVLIGASRVALGVHYPHDVVTGLLLGAGVVAVLVLLLRAPVRRALELSPSAGRRGWRGTSPPR